MAHLLWEVAQLERFGPGDIRPNQFFHLPCLASCRFPAPQGRHDPTLRNGPLTGSARRREKRWELHGKSARRRQPQYRNHLIGAINAAPRSAAAVHQRPSPATVPLPPQRRSGEKRRISTAGKSDAGSNEAVERREEK